MYNLIFLINEKSRIMTSLLLITSAPTNAQMRLCIHIVLLEHLLLLAVNVGPGLKIDVYSHWIAMQLV